MADTRDADKLRRRTHLPRDSQGFIRVQWLENFFETLYASNERGINIPYTVVFQYRRIYAAYYTDADGYVQKIDKIADLGPEQVIEVLRNLTKKSGGASQMGCSAYYVYSKKQDEAFPITEATSNLNVEYFDDSSLTHFLTYRGKENNGMLQQFQEPAGSVSTIRAYWTAHYCQLETRMNVHKTDDTSIPLEQRAVTFEGELYHSRSFPISSKVEGRIKSLINRIVGHLTDCLPSNVKIQLMMLNFRIGANGKIWFLYCNCLKLYDQSLESIGYGRDSQGARPNSAKLVEASIPPQGLSARASKKRLGIVCPSTDTRLGPFEKYKVKVQAIFLHFLWHGPTEAWAKLGRTAPDIPLENGKDPGTHAHILRVFVAMDLRPSPRGRPFFWNAEIDEKSRKQKDPNRWTESTKEAHAQADQVMEKVFVDKPDIKAAYRYWEATMVFLIAQEQDNLTQENFKQQRIRPAFLQSELHCCEHALLVYNSTMEEVLEEERKRLYRLRAPFETEGPPWSRMGVHPQALRRDTDSSARSRNLNRSGAQTARELTLPRPPPSVSRDTLSSEPVAELPVGGRRALTARAQSTQGSLEWDVSTERRYNPSLENRDLLFPFKQSSGLGGGGSLGSLGKAGELDSRTTRRMLATASKAMAAPPPKEKPGRARSGGTAHAMAQQPGPGRRKPGGVPVLPSVIVNEKLLKQLTDQLTPRNPFYVSEKR